MNLQERKVGSFFEWKCIKLKLFCLIQLNNLNWYLDDISNFLLPNLKIHNLYIYSLRMHSSFYQFTYHTLFTNCSSTANCIWVHSLLEWICKWLKNLVSEETLNWQSPSADLCIHFYCLSELRQASQRKMIQSSAIRQRLRRFKILTCPLLKSLHRGGMIKLLSSVNKYRQNDPLELLNT